MNKINSIELTHSLANEILRYDPLTGKLYWNPRDISLFVSLRGFKVWNAQHANTEAFTSLTHCGYKNGRIFNKTYRAHRVIWLMVYGHWPEWDIDHIDGNRTNNALINLRSVERPENCKNNRIQKRNKTGFHGVQFCEKHGTYRVSIGVGGTNIRLGSFKSKDEAVKVRLAAEKEYGYHPNHGRS